MATTYGYATPLATAPATAETTDLEIAKTMDYTVLAADNGKLFTNAGATAAVIFTLPTLAAGLRYSFLVLAEFDVTITCTDVLVVEGDAAADSIKFDVPGLRVGSFVRLQASEAADKWYITNYVSGGGVTVGT